VNEFYQSNLLFKGQRECDAGLVRFVPAWEREIARVLVLGSGEQFRS